MSETCIPDVVCFNKAKVESLRREIPDPAELERRAELLKAVAHRGRLAVLQLISLEECCVCDVAHTLYMPVSTASQHLRRLKRAGLLRSRPDGKLVMYSIADPELASLALDGVNGAER